MQTIASHSAQGTLSPTIHYPRPPLTETASGCSDKRSFGPAMHTSCGAQVQVVRYADINVAGVKFENNVIWSAQVVASPAELRELAARLIDAAHDIETFPGAALEGGAA